MASFMFCVRTRQMLDVLTGDVAITAAGDVSDGIRRYHDVLARLAGRADLREDPTKYEAVALLLAAPGSGRRSHIIGHYPEEGSPLLFSEFFSKLYLQYDQRFVFAAPDLESTTRRVEWHHESPLFQDWPCHEYEPRLSSE